MQAGNKILQVLSITVSLLLKVMKLNCMTFKPQKLCKSSYPTNFFFFFLLTRWHFLPSLLFYKINNIRMRNGEKLVLCHFVGDSWDIILCVCLSTSGQYEFFISIRDWNVGFFACARKFYRISMTILCLAKEENLISDCFREVSPSSFLSRLFGMLQRRQL